MAVFESVASILMMIGIGVFMAWKLDFRETNSAGMVSLVTNITLPAYMISNICMNYDRATLIAMAPGLVVPFVSISLCCTLGFAVAWLISVPRQRRGTFCSMFSLSNTIFIGLPVNTMLFGPDSIPFVLLFYIGNTTLFWTIGTYFINLDGDRPTQRILSAANLKRIFSPPLYMFLFAVVLVLLELRPPLMILNLCKTVGSMTTPLSMIFIGITLYAVNWRAIRPDLTMGALLVARFVIALPCPRWPLNAIASRGRRWTFPAIPRARRRSNCSMPCCTGAKRSTWRRMAPCRGCAAVPTRRWPGHWRARRCAGWSISMR